MDDTLKCYEILELEPGASAESVRHSYIELSHVWDPDRYVNNPVLRSQAEIKRREIEEAYQTLRNFLTELRGADPHVQTDERPVRDYNELAAGTSTNSTWIFMGVIATIIFLLVIACAIYVVMKGRAAGSASLPIG